MTKITKKILFTALSAAIGIFFMPCFGVFAQDDQQQSQTQKQSAFESARGNLNVIGGITGFGETQETGDAGLYDKIADIVNIVLGFAGVLAMIIVIYSGIKWITASGNEEQIKSSKDMIKGAIIGIGIIFFGYVFVNFVVAELITIFS